MVNRRFLRALVLYASSLLVVFLAVSQTKATTAILLSDREMVVDARVILTGRVADVFSAWDDDHSMIWTYVRIHRNRLLKGSLGESDLVLKQRGGIVGDIGIKIFGEPEFKRDERVLLYLETAPDGSLRVAQTFMGMFEISTDRETGKEMVSRRLDGADVSLWPRVDGQPVTNADTLEGYISRIKTTMRREAALISETEAARSGDPLLLIPAGYDRARSRRTDYSPAYVLTAGGLRWMQADTGQPITYHINPSNCPVGGGAQTEASRAMSAWPGQSGAGIHLALGSQTAGCGLGFDGQNEISFGDCRGDLPPPTGSCSGIVAMTSVEYSSQTEVVGGTSFFALIEAHTVFARGMDCILGNSSNLAEVMCHELGHSIGLAHSTDPSAIMWFMAHGNGRDATLGSDDKAGVLAIYPGSSTGGGGGGGGGGGSSSPVISRVKVKLSGKLIVFGDNFTPGSQIVLNGQPLPQAGTSFDASSGRLVFKGPVNVGPSGTNVLYVISGAGSSSAFVF